MEWAVGIEARNGELLAKFLTTQGEIESGSLKLFEKHGVPTRPNLATKKKIRTHFSTWLPGDTREYLDAFGVRLPDSVESKQQVFQFSVGRTRYVVPSLVLMRALFRPERYLLPAIFDNQALDHCCFIDCSASPPQPVIHAKWGLLRCASEGVKAGLSYLSCFPSARTMAGSVHQHALNGHINLTLPNCEVQLSVHGVKHRIQQYITVYVTEMTASFIRATELPFAFASTHPLDITLIAWTEKFNAAADVITHPNGETNLTDGEWTNVAPVLLKNMRRAKIKLDQRLIFEDILKKKHLGISWRAMQYQVGSWSHAHRAYEQWRKQGVFAEAVELLNKQRNLHRTDGSLNISAEL